MHCDFAYCDGFQVKKVQDEYNAAVAAKDPQAIQAALNSVDETQVSALPSVYQECSACTMWKQL